MGISSPDRQRRLLVLGAGPAQLGLLRAARARGLFVVACDRDAQAPGFEYADRRAIVSAEDEPAVGKLAQAEGIDGVIATNTTVARDKVKGLPHGDEQGGLSGAPVFEASTAVVKALAAALAGELPIIAAGGVLDGAGARAKLAAGATLVQLYSGMIYRGPALVRECVRATANSSRRAYLPSAVRATASLAAPIAIPAVHDCASSSASR